MNLRANAQRARVGEQDALRLPIPQRCISLKVQQRGSDRVIQRTSYRRAIGIFETQQQCRRRRNLEGENLDGADLRVQSGYPGESKSQSMGFLEQLQWFARTDLDQYRNRPIHCPEGLYQSEPLKISMQM